MCDGGSRRRGWTDAARRFYEAFGKWFHVQLPTSDDVNRDHVAAEALADIGLPAGCIDAATDKRWDDELRSQTRACSRRWASMSAYPSP